MVVNLAVRGEWLFKYVTLCLRHSRPLVGLASFRHLGTQYNCYAWLVDRRPEIEAGTLLPRRRKATGFDVWLGERLTSGRQSTWLDDFDLHTACQFCEFLGRALAPNKKLDSRDPAKQWAVFALGFDAASSGEQSIRAALDHLLEGHPELKAGPEKTLKAMYSRYGPKRRMPGEEAMAAVMDRYIADRWHNRDGRWAPK